MSPDAGGAKRATRVASKLGADCAIIAKERLKANEVSAMRLVGNVEDSVCVLVDDMADTCGTLAKAANLLKEQGAKKVFAYVVHGVLSGKAIATINSVHLIALTCFRHFVRIPKPLLSIPQCGALEKIVVSNTIPQGPNLKQCKKLEVAAFFFSFRRFAFFGDKTKGD